MGLKNLSSRLLLAILAPVVLVFVGVELADFRRDRETMLEIAESGATALADAVTEELQGVLRSTSSFIDGLGTTLILEPISDYAHVDGWLAEALREFPLLFGVAYALVPDPGAEPDRLARFVYREGPGLTTKDLSSDAYAYWDRSWYTDGFRSESGAWTEPYRGEGANDVRMVTYTRRFDQAERAAVVTGDLSLERLTGVANTNLLGRGGAVLVWDANGRLLVHPETDWQMDVSLADLAERLSVPLLAAIPAEVEQGRSGWVRPAEGLSQALIGGEAGLAGRLFFRPVNEAGWGIGVYFSDRDFLGDIVAAQRRTALFSALLFVVLTVLIMQVTRRGLRPLEELSASARAVARGDLDAPTPGRQRTDEIGRMARAFETMQHDLRHHIEDLTLATARQERIDTELETAREIQEMLLPAPRLDRGDLQIECMLRPARAVGGDLYLHRPLDDGRIFFAIGDVSDKGVPAALMMARALAVLESAMVQGLSPAEILGTSSETLSEHNELCMFATVIVGEYRPADGRLRLANAGHEFPILLGDGRPRAIEVPPGAPVGIDADESYGEVTLELDPGQCLLFYTDGLNEARAPDGELYGEERLFAHLEQGRATDCTGWMQHVLDGIDAFVRDAEAADDLTLILVQRNDEATAPSADSEAAGPDDRLGRVSEPVVDGAHDRVHAALLEALDGVPSGIDASQLRLVVEEFVTNIVKYAGLGDADRIDVFWRLEPEALELEFVDAGTPFDPLARDPDVSGSDSFESGGMGILLIRDLAESVAYEHRDGRNRMTVRLARGTTTEDEE